VPASKATASRSSAASGRTNRDARTRRLCDLLLEQSDSLQGNALDLLLQGDLNSALTVLRKAFEVLMALLDFRPADSWLEVRLGFLYKDLAQASRVISPAHQLRYLENGRHIFEELVRRKMDTHLLANAWNGLGNILMLYGEYEQAIEHIERAVDLLPEYNYAWADLFEAYYLAGKVDRPNLKAMRTALKNLKLLAGNDARLLEAVAKDSKRLRQLEARRPTRQ
jgi:tetratricopeptide (TPR) repeat protein